MSFRAITPEEKDSYNAVVSHPLQSYEWGEFREKTGVKVVRRGIYQGDKLVSGFSLTIHKIPKSPWSIGYFPKGEMPTQEVIDELKEIGKEEKCLFIQLEPNVIKSVNGEAIEEHSINSQLKPAAHPLFTKYDFILDLTKPEDELLKNMHSKARYNIRVAQRHEVTIVEDNTPEAFEQYWKIMEETTTRQKFYAHSKRYHELQWQTFNKKMENGKWKMANNLSSHLFLAKYQNKILAAWILFVFKDTLYYPYGSSSSEHREVMASNLIMWEAIKFGKKLDLKKFDMWGALGPTPDTKDPWFGFHNFKQKYGPDHIEFIGSFDLVINPVLYEAYKVADKLRWVLLKMKK